MAIQENTFAEACYNQNSVDELTEALTCEPDETDMAEWNLSAEDWREQINIALSELKSSKLADMAHYMDDAEMYAIEGMEYDDALLAIEAGFGVDRLKQLKAIAG